MKLTGTPAQCTGGNPIRNPGDELSANGVIPRGAEIDNEAEDLRGDRFIIEGAEGGDERGEEEVRVECEDGSEEGRVREGPFDLGEGVGHVDGWGVGVGDEVGEAEEADGAAVLRSQVERGTVALRARRRRTREAIDDDIVVFIEIQMHFL